MIASKAESYAKLILPAKGSCWWTEARMICLRLVLLLAMRNRQDFQEIGPTLMACRLCVLANGEARPSTAMTDHLVRALQQRNAPPPIRLTKHI